MKTTLGGNMELSKRLQAVADLVSKGRVVADIGCDHAYISIYLVANQIAKHVIAMDVNRGPLERAKENIKKNHYSQEIETRLSDGAKALQPKEADALLISGMGGGLMIKILSESKEVVENVVEIILQPQSEIKEVRKYLEKVAFEIIEENMVIEEGKYYTMMKARRKAEEEGISTKKEIKQEQLKKQENFLNKSDIIVKEEVFYRYGKYLLQQKNPYLKQFLQKEKLKYEKILEQLEESDMERNKDRYDQMKSDYQYCKEGLSYYEM